MSSVHKRRLRQLRSETRGSWRVCHDRMRPTRRTRSGLVHLTCASALDDGRRLDRQQDCGGCWGRPSGIPGSHLPGSAGLASAGAGPQLHIHSKQAHRPVASLPACRCSRCICSGTRVHHANVWRCTAKLQVHQVYEKRPAPKERPAPDDTQAYLMGITSRGVGACTAAGISLASRAKHCNGLMGAHRSCDNTAQTILSHPLFLQNSHTLASALS